MVKFAEHFYAAVDSSNKDIITSESKLSDLQTCMEIAFPDADLVLDILHFDFGSGLPKHLH